MMYRWIEGGKGLSILPETTYDLWQIRRILEKRDLIQAQTTREIKQEGDYIRPDKGRRISVRIKLSVEDVKFDNQLGRLRVKGVIVDSDNEAVRHGSYHSIEIAQFMEFQLWKQHYDEVILSILKRKQTTESYILLAVDGREAGFGILSGTSISMLGTVRSDIAGKMYPQDSRELYNRYMHRILDMIKKIVEKHRESKIILLGPGSTKNQLANFLKEDDIKAYILEGFDMAGEDGVQLAINTNTFREFVKGTYFERVSLLLEEIRRRLARDDKRLAFGFDSCLRAAEMKAIEYLIISDDLFRVVDEYMIVDLLNKTEASGSEPIMLDSSTLLAQQVSKMGGAVALLRYPLE
ncbi:MAG: hypothetical protein QXR69_01630 [Conexivisphaerales archaeon]